jgi:hypothetical protein
MHQCAPSFTMDDTLLAKSPSTTLASIWRVASLFLTFLFPCLRKTIEMESLVFFTALCFGTRKLETCNLEIFSYLMAETKD